MLEFSCFIPNVCYRFNCLIGIFSSMEAYRMGRLCHPSVLYIVRQPFQATSLKQLDQLSPYFSCGIRGWKFEQTVPELQIRRGNVWRIVQINVFLFLNENISDPLLERFKVVIWKQEFRVSPASALSQNEDKPLNRTLYQS